MSDTMVVAGIRYDQRDRRHYEEDEGSWIRSSSDKSMVPSVHVELRHQPNATNETRRRRQTRKTQSYEPPQEYTTGLRALVVIEKSIDSNVSSLNDLRRPQDGNGYSPWNHQIVTEASLVIDMTRILQTYSHRRKRG